MNGESKRIDDADLRRSLYYPACGTDLQPVLLAADRIQTFVYADWNETEERVTQAFVDELPGRLQLVESKPIPQETYGRARLRTVCQNPRSKRFRQAVVEDEYAQEFGELFPAGFQRSPEEESQYAERRRTANGVQKPWAREFVFLDNGLGKPRRLQLLYFSDEGMARYCVLYLRRGLAPQIVCTIRSGPGWGHGWTMLEQPDGAFERLLLACNPKPEVWIRQVSLGLVRGASRWNRPVPEFSAGDIQAFSRDPENP